MIQPRHVLIEHVMPHFAAMTAADWTLLSGQRTRGLTAADGKMLRHAEAMGLAQRSDKLVVFPAALIHRAVKAIQARGWHAEVIDAVFRQYASADASLLVGAELTQVQRAVLDRLNELGRGLYSVRPSDAVPIVEAVCRWFPDSPIDAIAANSRIARAVASELRRRGRVAGGVDADLDSAARVHITDVARRWWGHRRPAAITCLGADVILSSRVQLHLMMEWDAIRIALVEPLASLTPADQLTVEAFFGPLLLDLSRGPKPLFVPAVVTLPAAAYPAVGDAGALERKRQCVWHNHSRNRQVAKLATALAVGDSQRLQAAGEGDVADVLPGFGTGRPRKTVVLVECYEHAKELRRLLPNWEILHEVTSKPPLGVHPDAAIVTLPFADEVGINVRAVVYAAGCGECWNRRWGPAPWLAGTKALVVDVIDDFDAEAKRQAERRQEDYRSLGWKGVQEDQVDHRAEAARLRAIREGLPANMPATSTQYPW